MVHETAKAMQTFITDGVRGIFECGEQDQLEQYVMAKVWDDPSVDVDAVIGEFFRLYFGAAGEPGTLFLLVGQCTGSQLLQGDGTAGLQRTCSAGSGGFAGFGQRTWTGAEIVTINSCPAPSPGAFIFDGCFPGATPGWNEAEARPDDPAKDRRREGWWSRFPAGRAG